MSRKKKGMPWVTSRPTLTEELKRAVPDRLVSDEEVNAAWAQVEAFIRSCGRDPRQMLQDAEQNVKAHGPVIVEPEGGVK